MPSIPALAISMWDSVAANTVFMPVAAIDGTLEGLNLPATIDVVKFLVTLILALPFGFASRLVPLGAPRHVYNLFLGVAFAQGCYGPGWLHMPFSAAVAYMMMLVAPRRLSGLLVFAWMMLYIGGTHVYRMYNSWLGWDMDFSGPQMMATIKLTSCAFNYNDGRRGRSAEERANELEQLQSEINERIAKGKEIQNENEQKEIKRAINELRTKKDQQNLAIDDLPSPLAFFAWVQNFSTYQAGPALEIQEYLKVNNGGIEERLPGGCVAATLRQFVLGVVCLASHMVLAGRWPLGDAALGLKNPMGPLSYSFLEMGIVSRVCYCIVGSFGVQFRYFMAWKLGEAAATSFGYGSNGGKWNGCQNIDVRAWLLADNMSEASKVWNQKTQAWLQAYTYRRYPGGRSAKLLATYAVSAYWHGFYPGYYITFFTLGLLNMCQDTMKAHIRPYFCADPRDEKAQNVFESVSKPKQFYDVMGIFGMTWIKTFATLPFLLSTFGNAWACALRLHFLGVMFTLAGLFLVPLVPKKRKGKKE